MKNFPKALPYEIFIRIAFNCEKGTEHGASAHYMKNLLDAEDAKDAEAPQLLAQLKSNIEAALEEFTKQELTVDEKLELMAMKHKVQTATTGNELCSLVDESLKVTGKLLR